MEAHYWWWLLALALGIAEILTGTIFLLVLALSFLLGGATAWLGFGGTVQLLVTSTCAFVGWGLLLRQRTRTRARHRETADGLMRLDVGQALRIDDWQDERRARVRYRGAQWRVELAGEADDARGGPGDYVITRIENNRLIVVPAR